MRNLFFRAQEWGCAVLALGFFVLTPVAQQPSSTTQAPDQYAPNFIGYVSSTGSYVRITCAPELIYSSSGSYAACLNMSHTRTAIATTCVSGSMPVYPRSTVTCPETAPLCAWDYVNSNLKDEVPLTMIGCGTTSDPWDYYRETTTSASLGSTSHQDDSSTLATVATSTSRESSPSSDTPSQDSPSKQTNLAWIAGPIVGGIAGIAIIALLTWIVILLRRRVAR
ncbi:unnamed protein product [Clonostachys chloroleuca]|uniref:Uncharacterized protein n=1 Tax=Clonostachys chloroleuca TaxID=1926264 RepID=A0AA35MCX7_9HYPO|nr:unnamed protein product [Clonostachys chloroleuca]